MSDMPTVKYVLVMDFGQKMVLSDKYCLPRFNGHADLTDKTLSPEGAIKTKSVSHDRVPRVTTLLHISRDWHTRPPQLARGTDVSCVIYVLYALWRDQASLFSIVTRQFPSRKLAVQGLLQLAVTVCKRRASTP